MLVAPPRKLAAGGPAARCSVIHCSSVLLIRLLCCSRCWSCICADIHSAFAVCARTPRTQSTSSPHPPCHPRQTNFRPQPGALPTHWPSSRPAAAASASPARAPPHHPSSCIFCCFAANPTFPPSRVFSPNILPQSSHPTLAHLCHLATDTRLISAHELLNRQPLFAYPYQKSLARTNISIISTISYLASTTRRRTQFCVASITICRNTIIALLSYPYMSTF